MRSNCCCPSLWEGHFQTFSRPSFYNENYLFTSGKHQRQLPPFPRVDVPASSPQGQTVQCPDKQQKKNQRAASVSMLNVKVWDSTIRKRLNKVTCWEGLQEKNLKKKEHGAQFRSAMFHLMKPQVVVFSTLSFGQTRLTWTCLDIMCHTWQKLNTSTNNSSQLSSTVVEG